MVDKVVVLYCHGIALPYIVHYFNSSKYLFIFRFMKEEEMDDI